MDFERFSAEPNDTAATAETISSLPFTISNSKITNGSDENDYYKFTATASGKITIRLRGLSADLQLKVYDVNQSLQGQSLQPGTSDEEVTIDAVSGRLYYIRVQSFNNSTSNYDLSGFFDDGNGTFVTAGQLALTSLPFNLNSGIADNNDENDYFKFTALSTGRISVKLSNLSADLRLKVYDNLQNLQNQSNVSGSGDEEVFLDVVGGQQYYVLIQPFNNSVSNYRLTISAASDGNDGFNTAQSIPINTTLASTTAGGSVDPNDYYQFTTTSAGNITVTLTGLSGNLDVYVYASNMSTEMGRGTSSGTTSENVSFTGAAGTYYVLVTGGSNATYTLGTTFVSTDDGNNGFNVAQTIPINSTLAPTTAGGTNDPNDYYKFNTTSSGAITVTLTGLSGNLDVYVYASNMSTEMGRGTTGGSTSESVSFTGAAGTYYVLVTGSSNATYTLGTTFVASDGNDSFNTAQTISLNSNLSPTTAGGSGDPNDYYKFTTTSPGAITVTLTGLSGNLDVYVYASNMSTEMGRGTAGGSTSENVSFTGAAGTYYVLVTGGSNATYTLGTTFVSTDDGNNGFNTAQTIPLNSTLAPTTAGGSGDPDDYYRFTTTSSGAITVTLTGLSGNLDVYVYASNMSTEMGRGTTGGSTSENVTFTAAAGTYYVLVTGGSNATYTLGTTFVASDDGNNGFNVAQTISLNATLAPTTAGGTGDPNDYYKFTTTSAGAITVTLTGLTGNLDVYVYASDMSTEMGRGTTGGIASENVSFTGAAGTYYVLVTGGSNATYTLGTTFVSTDDGNNGFNTAQTIPLNTTLASTTAGGSADPNDYYQFTTTASGSITVTLTGLSDNLDVYVYASDRTTEMGRSVRFGITSESVNFVGAAGTYYVLVTGTNNASYTLGTTFVATDDGNNSFSAAQSIPVNTTLASTTAGGSADPNDYYQFTTTASGSITVTLTGLSDNLDVYVYASDRTTEMGRGVRFGITSESVNFVGAAGTYYVLVTGTNNASYTLGTTFAAGDGNDSMATATPLIVGNTATTTVGGRNDEADWYKFTASGTGKVRITATGLTADLDIIAYGSNGSTQIGSSTKGGSSDEDFTVNVNSGDVYFLKVYGGRNSAYTLGTAFTRESDGNGSYISAEILTAGTTKSASVGGDADQDDYYRFTASENGIVRLTVTGSGSNPNVRILDRGLRTISSDAQLENTNRIYSFAVSSGQTYYVHLYSDSNISYTLSTAFASGDDGNGSFRTASPLSIQVPVTSTVGGSADQNDYYWFTATGDGTVPIFLSNQTETLRVDAFDSRFGPIGSRSFAPGATIGLGIQVEAGKNYFLQISGSATSTYTLGTFFVAQGDGNDTPSTAMPYTLGTAVNSIIAPGDVADYFRFVAGATGKVSIALSGLSADLNVRIQDGSQTTLASGTNGSSTAESFTFDVTSGATYYIKVEPNGSAQSNYSLSTNFTQVVADDGDSTLETATLRLSTFTVSNSVGGTDRADYSRIVAVKSGQLQISLKGLSGDLDLRLFNNDRVPIASSTNGGSADEYIYYDVVAGKTYYVSVSSDISAASAYNMAATIVTPTQVSPAVATASIYLQLALLSNIAYGADVAFGENPTFGNATTGPSVVHLDERLSSNFLLDSRLSDWVPVEDSGPGQTGRSIFQSSGYFVDVTGLSTRASGFVAYNPRLKALALVFTGSSGFWEVATDAATDRDDQYEKLKPLIQFAKAEALKRGVPLYVTGHSLGGALAALFVRNETDAYEIVNGQPDKRLAGVTAVTFASPGPQIGVGTAAARESGIINFGLVGDPVFKLLANDPQLGTQLKMTVPVIPDSIKKGLLYPDYHHIELYIATLEALIQSGYTFPTPVVSSSSIAVFLTPAFTDNPYAPIIFQAQSQSTQFTVIGSAGDDTINTKNLRFAVDGLPDSNSPPGSYWIHGGAGKDVITGSTGNDSIAGGSGQDVIGGGDGADTFVFDTLDGGLDVVTDFNKNQGDRIDLTSLFALTSYLGNTPFADKYLVASELLSRGGTDIRLQFARDGGGKNLVDVAIFKNSNLADIKSSLVIRGSQVASAASAPVQSLNSVNDLVWLDQTNSLASSYQQQTDSANDALKWGFLGAGL